MKRPLKWLVGLNESDPEEVETKTASLLREGPAVLEHALLHGSGGLKLLLEKDSAKPVDRVVITLGARLFSHARAVSILLRRGYTPPAILVLREMIHSLVLVQFFRANPEKAKVWDEAKDWREREKFAFRNIWKHVEHGEEWKKTYDFMSNMAHANAQAKVTYGQLRKVFGYDLQLRGFYDPKPIAHWFVSALQVTIWFQGYFYDWYRQELSIPTSFESDLNTLATSTKVFKKELTDRAAEEAKHPRNDTMSTSEQVDALAWLWYMMEQKHHNATDH
jgi:hypothetical protein